MGRKESKSNNQSKHIRQYDLGYNLRKGNEGFLDVIKHTVNSEIFARILFSQIALKCKFAMLKIWDKGVIYLNERVILPICECFVFMKLCICEDS